MNKTDIEYLDYTWNPLAMKCTPVSDGCANCWHLKFANRHAHNPQFSEKMRKAYAGGEPYLRRDELTTPLKLKKPSRIGVQFMGDLFHDDVTYKHQYDIFWEMDYNCKHHTFIVLTKRPENMRKFYKKRFGLFPPENIWLGVTAENQEEADKRIPILLDIPAAVRFVSSEPLLSFLDLSRHLLCSNCGGTGYFQVDPYPVPCIKCSKKSLLENDIVPIRGTGSLLDWVICGGESGHGARPMHPDRARSIRDQCIKAEAPFFFKQWGEWAPLKDSNLHISNDPQSGMLMVTKKVNGVIPRTTQNTKPLPPAICYFNDQHRIGGYFKINYSEFSKGFLDRAMAKIGKKAAGRLLDGQTWDEMPHYAQERFA